MNPLKRSPLNGSAYPVALTAIAAVASLSLERWLEPVLPLFFLAAVWLSAWRRGRSGGALAAALSSVALLYLFLKPGPPWTIPSAIVLSRVLAFLVVALVVTWVTASWREGRRLLAATLSSIGDAVLTTDNNGRVTFLNPAAEALTGWTDANARGKHVNEVMRLISERSRDAVENPVLKAVRERVALGQEGRTVLVGPSGAEAPVEHGAAPIRDDAGVVRGGVLVFRDISARRHLEEQVTHAEKMDAVGRLAGGVAGDFNNVLTLVTGYAELLRAETPAGDPARRFVDEIAYAAERAAALTRHLLAFSTGPAPQPRALDLNAVVNNMEPMLRRLLGQHVELVLLASPGLGHVNADAGQIEQVIVNLATNARDAMPQGGKLVLETANVDLADPDASKSLGLRPGPYVMLAVSDTGVGMSAETRTRLFEPFFTTKEPGKGSGLGLATVYGAVKQSEGQVTVYSQPNCGTIFEIYLPRVREVAPPAVRRTSSRGSETILLVEDEDAVRQLLSAILKANGYDVIEANSGKSALSAHEKNSHKIDLLLTDVVMPEMDGFELGEQIAGRSPKIKILYVSGYREGPAGAPGGPPKQFLPKPFTPDVLLAKIREVLDSEPA